MVDEVEKEEEEESRTNKEDIDERTPDASDKRPPWNLDHSRQGLF